MHWAPLTGVFHANRAFVRFAIQPVRGNVKPGFRALKVENCFIPADTAILPRDLLTFRQLESVIIPCAFRDMPMDQKE